MTTTRILLPLGLCCFVCTVPAAREPDCVLDLWNGPAPGETSRYEGDILPRRRDENPPATRIANITRPQLEVYEPNPDQRTKAAVLILPGGGFNYIVRDKEGSEAAEWLNGLGITGCVLRYRTKDGTDRPLWQRPLQDGHRALSLLRSRVKDRQLDPGKMGVLGFSAGGQVAALIATRFHQRAYDAADEIDSVSCRPDFVLLLYPWQLINAETGTLMNEITVTPETPPTFLVHAHNDSWTSMSSVLFYSELRRHGVSSELHIYETGGHGYGLRPVPGSLIHTWPSRAAEWLRLHAIATE